MVLTESNKNANNATNLQMILTFSPVKMLLFSTFTAVFISSVAVSWMTGVRTEKCQSATDLQKGLTCTFNKTNDTCSWIVNDSSKPPLWIIDVGSRTFEAEIYRNGTVQLQSPKICPTNGLSSLQFKYFIQNDGCEQSVFFVVDSGDIQLSSTYESTNNQEHLENITINNQNQEFKIVLQSRRVQDTYCRFRLRDIYFKYSGEGSGSTLPSTDGETSGSALPGDESPGSGSLGNESLGGGLSGAGIAGIIVSLVVIIAVLVIVFFLLRRRKAGGEIPFIQTESSPQHVSELDVVEDTNGQNIGSSETSHGASGAGSPTNTRGECPYEDIRETGGTYYSALDHRGNTDNTYSSLQNSYENATGKAKEDEEGSYTQLQRPSPQTER